jgi:antitoxin VapB
MAILIKNPATERKARELAQLKGGTITGVIDAALERELAAARPAQRRPTVEEMIAATERFRMAVGLDKRPARISRADFDELWEDDPPSGGAE